VSDQSSVDPKTKPVIAGHNTWTHTLLAGLKLDHLNVLGLNLTLRPNDIATLTATIAVDLEQDDAVRQALEHRQFALLELTDEPEIAVGELPASELVSAPESKPEPEAEPAKPKAKRRKATAPAAA
jgi:hypothetical protein